MQVPGQQIDASPSVWFFSMHCHHTLYLGVPAVRKEPDSPADAARLEQERRWLARAAHPGVVRLLPVATSPALWTRDVGERRLEDLGSLEAPVVCGLGAAAATILADLHDLGIVHGAPCADHLLIDSEGRPVLCSFGRAAEATAAGAREDVRTLAVTLLGVLGPDAPRRLGKLLTVAAGTGAGPTARQLARDLARATPRPLLAPAGHPGSNPSEPDHTPTAEPPRRQGLGHARPGRAPSGTRPGSRRATPSHAALVVTATLAALVVAAGAFGGGRQLPSTAPATAAGPSTAGPSTGPTARTSRAARPPATARADRAAHPRGTGHPPGGALLARAGREACPPVDVGCEPIPLHDGLFVAGGRRWRLSEPSDLVALGRFACAGALPAVLDPRTGQLWVFAAWTARTATAVAAVPAATSLSAVPLRSGCDLISVTRRKAPSVLVNPLPALTAHG